MRTVISAALLKPLLILALVMSVVTLRPARAPACTCKPVADNFFQAIAHNHELITTGKTAPQLTIVLGTVTEYGARRHNGKPASMLLELTGAIDSSNFPSNLWVRGDDGNSCMPPVTSFALGTTYLFALMRDEQENVYYVPSCGPYFQKLESVQSTLEK